MRRLRWCTVFVAVLIIFFGMREIICAEVTVIAEHASSSFASVVQDNVTSGLDIIARMLGHMPSEPVTVVLTGTDDEFSRLTGDILPEWSSAVAIGGNRIIVAPVAGWTHELNRVIVHEVTHIVIASAAGDRFVPRWFHEGCAQYLAAEWGVRDHLVLVWHTINGSLMTFSGIEDMFDADRVNATLAYDQSWLAVRHLRDRHGEGIVADIIAGLVDGESFPKAFWDATGVWPSEFEEDYRARITSVYGWKSIYLLIPSVWTFILILAVVAYLVKRRRNRELLKNWEIIEAAEKIIHFENHRTSP